MKKLPVALTIAVALILVFVPGVGAEHDIPWRWSPDCDGGFWPTGPQTHVVSGVVRNSNHVVAFWGGGLDGVGGGVWETVDYNPAGFVKTVTDGAGCITTPAKARAVIARECAGCGEIDVRRAQQVAITNQPKAPPPEEAAPVAEEEPPRYSEQSGLDIGKVTGFLVFDGEIGAVAAGSIFDSGVGPVKMYFPPGGPYEVKYVSGRLWVGRSDLVEREVASACPQGCTQLPLVLLEALDGRRLDQQLAHVIAAFLAAADGDFKTASAAWVKAHNATLIRDKLPPITHVTAVPAPAAPVVVAAPAPPNAVKVADGQTVIPPWGVKVRGADGQSYLRVTPGGQMSTGPAQLVSDLATGSAWRDSGEWSYQLPPNAVNVHVVVQGDAPVEVRRSGGRLVATSNADVTRRAPTSIDDTPKPPTGSSGVSLLVLVQ